MENVKTFRVYNLLNANGERLRLRLGYTVDNNGTPCNGKAGWKWSFNGKNIPMPVRSGTWFDGFPEPIMISWLKGNGWHLQTRVEPYSGYAKVFELPNGNENTIDIAFDRALDCALRLMWNNGNHLHAMHLYCHINGCTIAEAQIAVKGIVDRQK